MATSKKTSAEIVAEINELKEQQKKLAKEQERLAEKESYNETAGKLHDFYQSFIEAGFSEEQAWFFVKESYSGLVSGNSAPPFARGGIPR